MEQKNRGNAGKGRVKGSRNKATAAVMEVARVYTAEAVEALVKVLRDPQAPHAAIVSAANSLLDRGHGKPPQHVSMDGEINHHHDQSSPFGEWVAEVLGKGEETRH